MVVLERIQDKVLL